MGEKTGRFTRRKMLAAAGAAVGAGLLGGYIYRDRIVSEAVHTAENLYRRVKRRRDSDLDGLPDDLEEDPAFRTDLEDLFDTSVDGFDPEWKDLIIDARYVEGETFADENKEYLQGMFQDRAGVTLHWLDYPQQYPRDEFLEEYGYDPADILWGEDSFYEQEVEDWLKDTALQVVFSPGKPDGEHEGALYCAPGDKFSNGFSALNRVAVGSGSQQQKLSTTLHEILHLGNWEHNYDDPDDPGVMGQQEVVDATPEQWDRFKHRLHLVNLSAPSFIYDYALELTECDDMQIPEK